MKTVLFPLMISGFLFTAPVQQQVSVYTAPAQKEIRAKYTFEQNVLMESKSWDKKGKSEEKKTSRMRMHFSSEPYNGMEIIDEKGSPSFTIFESDRNQLVMLMNAEPKMAIVRKMDPAEIGKTTANESGKEQAMMKKTGAVKKICGYNCEEWTMTNEKGDKSDIWISGEVPLKLNGSFSMFGMQNKEFSKNFNAKDYPAGFMLEMVHTKANGEKFVMTATEVNLNAPKTVETAGYKVF